MKDLRKMSRVDFVNRFRMRSAIKKMNEWMNELFQLVDSSTNRKFQAWYV